MIIHFKHHKENRNFQVRPVTGNYTDLNVFINTKRFKYSPYTDGEFKDYPFSFSYINKEHALTLVKTINDACNSIVIIYNDYNNEIRMVNNFPEILDEMPSKYDMPRAYPTNPSRLVEIIAI